MSTWPPTCPRCGSTAGEGGPCPACAGEAGARGTPGGRRATRSAAVGVLAMAAIAGSVYSVHVNWPEAIPAAPPAAGASPATPGGESTRSRIAHLPGSAGPVLALGRAREPGAPPRPLERGLLAREVVRQAVLIAARDGLGLATRDATLGDAPDTAGAPEVGFLCRLGVGSGVTIRRGGGDAAAVLLDRDLSKAFTDGAKLPGLVEGVERLAREGFPEALKQAGFAGAPARQRPGAPLPAGVDRRLAAPVPTAQFAALRQVHRAIRADGESPARLGALARAYANLGLLTESHWGAAHQAFTARALLYAQRMVAREPQSATALRHRAYARALAGFPGAALADLEASSRDPAPAPPWSPLIDAYCRHDLDRLAAAPADPALKPLATLLRFLAAEVSGGQVRSDQGDGNSGFLREAGRAALGANPECYRVIGRLCGLADIGLKHEMTALGPMMLSSALPRRLRDIPDLPEEVRGALARGAKEPDVVRALMAAGAAGRDDGEPSWGALGSLIREERFVMTRDRAEFLRFTWSVPLDEFLAEARPLIADHPCRALIETYASPIGRLTAASPGDLGIVDFHFAAYDYAVNQRSDALWQAACVHADQTAPDLRFIAQHNGQAPYVLGAARRLREVDPHTPYTVAAEIEGDWTAARAHAAAWERQYAGHPIVLAALARHYIEAKEGPPAERCLDGYLRLSPDLWAYRAKARLARARGDEPGWREALEAFVAGSSTGLDKATALVELADDHMGRKEWSRAVPYADAAAETWACWAMLPALKCHEELGDWGEAEALARGISGRYPEDRAEWFHFCERTCRGDVRGALRLLTAGYDRFVDRLDDDSLALLGTLHILDRHPKRALEVFRKALAAQDNPAFALHAALLADELGDVALRDALLTGIVEGPKSKDMKTAQVLKLFRQSFAGPEPRAVDLAAVDDWIARMAFPGRGNAPYWVGRFLELHGRKEDAVRYYKRGVAAVDAAPYLRVLAADALRRAGLDPAEVVAEAEAGMRAAAEKPAVKGP